MIDISSTKVVQVKSWSVATNWLLCRRGTPAIFNLQTQLSLAGSNCSRDLWCEFLTCTLVRSRPGRDLASLAGSHLSKPEKRFNEVMTESGSKSKRRSTHWCVSIITLWRGPFLLWLLWTGAVSAGWSVQGWSVFVFVFVRKCKRSHNLCEFEQRNPIWNIEQICKGRNHDLCI